MTVYGRDDSHIADALDIDRSTLWRWKTHDPAYRAALDVFRAQITRAISDRCRMRLLEAFNRLDDLGELATDPKVRLRANEILIRNAHRYVLPPNTDDSIAVRVETEEKPERS